jgi:hypothetical protein
MGLVQKIKYYLFNAFREVFMYHHSSLEFRAKLFASVISANPNAGDCEFTLVKENARQIYNDASRSAALELTVREIVTKVVENNGLNNDDLIEDIMRDIKDMPRYTKKIDIAMLRPYLECHHNEEISIYQMRIIELFERQHDAYDKNNTPL